MTIEPREPLRTRPRLSDRDYDVALLRTDFPILFREVYGKPLVYLDNSASAQKPLPVIEAMDHAYRFEYANVHRGLHYLANAATAKYEEAREIARRFLNAAELAEIIFTRNATSAINLVAQSFGSLVLKPGDEIVLSIMEHHSNIVPWHYHRERRGIVLKWAPITDAGELDLEAYEALLGPRVKMVALTHMSNVLGTIVPVKQAIRLARARGIPVLIDGSQAAVHCPVDVRDLDCDFYVFTGHKVYGPSGIGVLYGRKELLDAMPPYEGGGEMIDTVQTDAITYGPPPQRFEAGTPPIVEAVGLGAALTYMMEVGRERIARHEAALKDHAHTRLGAVPGLTIYGTAADKGAIIAFNLEGLHPHDVATIVDRSGIAIRAGHHCAQPLMTRLGVTATCRASCAMYTTEDEIDTLAEALNRARELFT